MWFWIWCALVVGSLTGAFFLGRSLWRKVKALTRALDGLGVAAAGAPGRVQERIAASAAGVGRGVDVGRERGELVALVQERRGVRRGRALSRRSQHASRYAAWRMIDR
ncbi:hypothetical protein [Sanguibacter antarcticus]|nr:hypothetical protein [Sanguibacter antarcticus]